MVAIHLLLLWATTLFRLSLALARKERVGFPVMPILDAPFRVILSMDRIRCHRAMLGTYEHTVTFQHENRQTQTLHCNVHMQLFALCHALQATSFLSLLSALCHILPLSFDSSRRCSWMLKDSNSPPRLQKRPPGHLSWIPPNRVLSHTINTGDNPVHQNMYKMSPKERVAAETIGKDLLNSGCIQPSSPPYSSPIFFVQKKNGSLRMCVDYQALTQQTVKIPTLSD